METSRREMPDADQIAHFRFPVTWNSLVNQHVLTPSIRTPRAANDSTVQWSMVVPRMPSPAPALALPAAGLSEIASFAQPRYVAPKFEVSLDAATLAVKVILLAGVAMLVIPGWRDTGSPGARAVEMESAMNRANWVQDAVDLPPRPKPTGEFVLFRPSLDKPDYRLEFNWRANPRSLAWVFRVADTDNYYGVRMKLVGPRTISVEHFLKYRGVERSRVSKVVALSRAYLAVRMDAAGSTFKIFADGSAISQWTDNRLAWGGIGFLENGNNRTDVQSVRVSFP
jgi:hypothetical protein